MKDRSLKIGYGIRISSTARWNSDLKSFPRLMLQGNWLADAGFNTGDRVTVKVSDGQLIIEKVGGENNG